MAAELSLTSVTRGGAHSAQARKIKTTPPLHLGRRALSKRIEIQYESIGAVRVYATKTLPGRSALRSVSIVVQEICPIQDKSRRHKSVSLMQHSECFTNR